MNATTYPSTVDARKLAAFGWEIAAIDNYVLAVTRDGVTLEAEYSRASNGVLFSRVIDTDGSVRPITRRGRQSARDAFLEVAEIMAR